MNQPLGQCVQDYLRAHHVMTLATTAPDGPWAAAVFYVNEGYTLYFLSSPNSRHCRNLERDGRAAATIQADYTAWPEIKGVQLEGHVRLLTGKAAEHARQLYTGKFPLIGELGQAPAAILAALARVRWYSVTPTRLLFIDNAAGFGHRDEVALDEDGN
jgi:uncharacterized protein YhbP (UPF0306 family)